MTDKAVEVRRATAADVAMILSLERASDLAPHWSEAIYREMIGHEDQDPAARAGVVRILLVAVQRSVGGNHELELIVGFAVASVLRHVHPLDSNGAELESVAVEAAHRGKGIGRLLCHELIAWCCSQGATDMELEVRSNNAPALGLYRALGFKETGRRPRYYALPVDDALTMRLDLGETGTEQKRPGTL